MRPSSLLRTVSIPRFPFGVLNVHIFSIIVKASITGLLDCRAAALNLHAIYPELRSIYLACNRLVLYTHILLFHHSPVSIESIVFTLSI